MKVVKIGSIFLLVVGLLLSGCGGGGGGGSENIQNPITVTTGVTEAHLAQSGSDYDWYSYVPEGIDSSRQVTLLIDGGITSFDYSEASRNAKSHAGSYSRFPLAENNIIVIVPAMPRSSDPNIYCAALTPETFSSPVDDFYLRPDLKMIEIINEAKTYLSEGGLTVADRVIMNGYSAGGMFAQRFALLHPELVKMVVAGQAGGALAFPETEYEDGFKMNWPVGINDIEQYTGSTFKSELYRAIPQFFYIGDQDTGPYQWTIFSPEWGFNVWEYTLEQSQWFYSTFGNPQPVSFENQANYMISKGYDVSFTLYPGVGHTITEEMYIDIWAYIAEKMAAN